MPSPNRPRRADGGTPPPPASTASAEEAARSASLRYVSDARPGISRRASGTGFSYLAADGSPVHDEATLARIRALAIPPAWSDVWISPAPNGHIQATGRDARGRKQYRYHARWREVRDETKFEHMRDFAHALPRIRERVAADIARQGLPREKLLALVVRLLESTRMRVGNEEYARTNGSFGLTTLQNQHLRIEGTTLRFRFTGKAGKSHDVRVSDRRLAALVRRVRDLPGQELFQYIGDDDEPHPVDSADVNAYLKEIGGEEFTAKDFRTWTGTLLAVRELGARAAAGGESDDASDTPETKAAVKSTVARVVEAVAAALGNTPAVCRKSYIHPAVLEAYGSDELRALWEKASARETPDHGLSAEESALLRFLDACARREGTPAAA